MRVLLPLLGAGLRVSRFYRLIGELLPVRLRPALVLLRLRIGIWQG